MVKLGLAVALSMLFTAPAIASPDTAGPKAPASPHVLKRIPGPDGAWDYASYDAANDRIYVSRGYGVMAIDLKTGGVHPRFAQGVGVHSVVPLPSGEALVTTNGGDNTARVIDAKDGSLKATIPTGAKPDAAVYDPASGLVFVMDAKSGDMTVIDPKSWKVVKTIAVGGGLEFAAVDGKGRLYANVEDRNQIAVVDTRSLKSVGVYPLKGCDGPTGLALTETGVLISACANRVARLVDAASGADLGALKIGDHPDAVIYDRKRGLAYIPCGDSGVLVRIADANTRHPRVTSFIPTQKGAKTGALDPASGRLFLPTAVKIPAKNPRQNDTIVPGTFHVLVVG